MIFLPYKFIMATLFSVATPAVQASDFVPFIAPDSKQSAPIEQKEIEPPKSFRDIAERFNLDIKDKFSAFPGITGYVVHPKTDHKDEFIVFSDNLNYVIYKGNIIGFDGTDPKKDYLSATKNTNTGPDEQLTNERKAKNIDDSKLYSFLMNEYKKGEKSRLISNSLNSEKPKMFIFAELACDSCAHFFKAISQTNFADKVEIVIVPIYFISNETPYALSQINQLPYHKRFDEVIKYYKNQSSINAKGKNLKDADQSTLIWLRDMSVISQKHHIQGTPSFIWKNDKTGKTTYRFERLKEEDLIHFGF